MNPDKAPCPDGFNPAFYQKSWHLIGNGKERGLLEVLKDGRLPADLNRTHIVFIQKCELSPLPPDFRPISLCNVRLRS